MVGKQNITERSDGQGRRLTDKLHCIVRFPIIVVYDGSFARQGQHCRIAVCWKQCEKNGADERFDDPQRSAGRHRSRLATPSQSQVCGGTLCQVHMGIQGFSG